MTPDKILAEMERYMESGEGITGQSEETGMQDLIDHMREWFAAQETPAAPDEFACCSGPTRKGEHRHWCVNAAKIFGTVTGRITSKTPNFIEVDCVRKTSQSLDRIRTLPNITPADSDT